MAAVKFVCKTNDKVKHDDIKKKLYMAGGAIIREKVKDVKSGFEGELELISEGATLYRTIKDSDLALKVTLIK
jgi:hypothetical protein